MVPKKHRTHIVQYVQMSPQLSSGITFASLHPSNLWVNYFDKERKNIIVIIPFADIYSMYAGKIWRFLQEE